MSIAPSNPENEPDLTWYEPLPAIEAEIVIRRSPDHLMRELASALRGLAVSPRPCFCQHGLGNPMVKAHTEQCNSARAALLSAELYLGTPED